jgi:hypothetical protein
MLGGVTIVYLLSHPDAFVKPFHLVIAMSTTQRGVCSCPPHKKESVLTFGKQYYQTKAPVQETHIVLPDGGGIRGLASLFIVRELLVYIRQKEQKQDGKTNGEASTADTSRLPLACHYFSFMFGTSTGG